MRTWRSKKTRIPEIYFLFYKKYQLILEEELRVYSELPKVSYTEIFIKIYDYHYKDYQADFYEFENFKKTLADFYFDSAIQNYSSGRSDLLRKGI